MRRRTHKMRSIIKMNTGFYEPLFTSRVIESILHVNKWQLNRSIIKLLRDIISQNRSGLPFYLQSAFMFSVISVSELICSKISASRADRGGGYA